MTASQNPIEYSIVLEELYRGISDACGWQPFLKSLADWLGASGGRLITPLPSEQPYLSGNIPAISILAPSTIETTNGAHGTPVLEATIAHNRRTGSLALFRDDNLPKFGELERMNFELVVVHLRRAIELRHLLEKTMATLSASHTALDQIEAGVAYISSTAEVLHTNSAFRKLSEARDGFWIEDGCFVAMDSESQNALVSFLSRNLDHREDRLTMRLARRIGAPYQAIFHSIDHRESDKQIHTDCTPRAILMIDRAVEISQLDAAAIATKFKLTISEARLVFALVSGSDIATYAIEADISIHTARTHLKNIFAKLGTTSQAGLIRLVLHHG